MNSFRTYLYMLKLSTKSTMFFRISFISDMLSSIAMLISEFFLVYSLAIVSKNIGGWTELDLVILYIYMLLSTGIATSIFGSARGFQREITMGTLDLKLVKPMGCLLQVMGKTSLTSLVNKLILAVFLVLFSILHYQFHWTPTKIAFFAITILGGTLLYGGLMILSAAISFWTYDSDSLVRVITSGLRPATWYPLHIFSKAFMWLLTYLLPLGFMGYYPVFFMLDKPPVGFPSFFMYITLPVGCVTLLLACLIFQAGLRKYQGTGS